MSGRTRTIGSNTTPYCFSQCSIILKHSLMPLSCWYTPTNHGTAPFVHGQGGGETSLSLYSLTCNGSISLKNLEFSQGWLQDVHCHSVPFNGWFHVSHHHGF